VSERLHIGGRSRKNVIMVAYVCIYATIINLYIHVYGPGSSVGIATDYGLDGPGSNPGGEEIFRPSRPALRPTQPPVQSVPCFSQG